MRIRRTLPPVAPPLSATHLLHGLVGILRGQRYLNELEADVKKYFDVKYVFFVSSGKAALCLILTALKSLTRKQQVVVPAYTCFSVPSAIVKAGLKVIPCDVDPHTLDFDYDLLKTTITDDTLCVVPNHLFGAPSDIHQIMRLCKDRGIFVIEDAAQVMGVKYHGKMLGTIADAGFFSLARGKNITCGSGGILVTNSPQIARATNRHYVTWARPTATATIAEFLRVVAMRIFIHPTLYWLPAGLPALKLGETVFYKDFPVGKLSGMKAGLLNNWADTLERSNGLRAAAAAYYHAELGLTPNLTHSFAHPRFPVIVGTRDLRDMVHSRSSELGLGIVPSYPTAISDIPALRSSFNAKRFPVAEDIANRLLTLPTHHFVSHNDRKAICDLLKDTSNLSEMPIRTISVPLAANTHLYA